MDTAGYGTMENVSYLDAFSIQHLLTYDGNYCFYRHGRQP